MATHLTHGLMLGVPLLLFAGAFLAEWRRTAGEVLPTSLRLMALGSVGAGLVHGAVVGHHLHEAALLGWFFALLCLAQLVWVGVLMVAPRRRVVTLGVVANLAVIALWAWTRSVGVPFGVAGGQRERFTPADLLATAFEVGVVLAGLAWVHARSSAVPAPEHRGAQVRVAVEGVGAR